MPGLNTWAVATSKQRNMGPGVAGPWEEALIPCQTGEESFGHQPPAPSCPSLEFESKCPGNAPGLEETPSSWHIPQSLL